MLAENLLARTAQVESPWKPTWLPAVDVAGPAQMPVLRGCAPVPEAIGMRSFTKPAPEALRSRMLLHGFVEDCRLIPLIRDPGRYLQLAAEHLAVVTPDLSMRPGMPQHERVHSAWLNRAVGAFFQDRGLTVIPSIRWASLEDLEFILDGLPLKSMMAVSCQSILTHHEGRLVFEQGMRTLLERLRPQQVIVYGSMPTVIPAMVAGSCMVSVFPTDIHRAFKIRGC